MHSIIAFSLFASLASAAYRIQDDYTANNFASMFNWITGDDPTHGYVNYVDQNTAQSSGLYNTNNDQIYIGVDATNVASGRGRSSVRIESKAQYNHGLFILDLAHMPGGTCGSWPAFWLMGPNWPSNGEIDIIEGVNSQTSNSFAAHTSSGCSITNTGNFAGQLKTANCDVNALGQGNNVGCSIGSTNDQSYGTGFNAVGGGVYATEWTSEAVSIWHFPRSAIPQDITAGCPDPDNWGLPSAQFTGSCDIDEFIRNQQIVFDISFCGDWAGSVWSSDAQCAAKAGTCQDFVMNNPSAFKDTFWNINSLKVYQSDGFSTPSVATASSATPQPVSSAAVVPTTAPNVPMTGMVTKTIYASPLSSPAY